MRHMRTKKLLALLLAVVLIAGALPMTASAATQDDAIAWINKYMGKAIDVDGNGAWCVDLTKKYCSDLFGWSPKGDARDYRTFDIPSGWKRTKYTSGYTPAPGDIVIFDPTASNVNKLGHVGIVMSATSSSYASAEQSYGGKKYVSRVNHSSYKSVWGFIRPQFKAASCTHVKGSLLYFQKAHPHYACYSCAKCGAEMIDKSYFEMQATCTQCFAPPQISVDVVTGSASNISTTGATLAGSVLPKGAAVTEIGLHFGTSKDNLPWVWSGKVNVQVGSSYHLMQSTSAFKTLQPNTTYYYMVYAYQNGQYKYGGVKSFTTKAASVSAVSTTGSATNITDTSAALHGSTVVTGGKTTSIGIQMGTSLDNTPQLMGEYLSQESYKWDYVAKNLKPNTTYYYRVFSSVNGQFFFGKYETFTTLSTKENTYSLSYYYYSGSQKNGHEEKTSEELPCRFVVRSPEDTRKGYVFKGWSWNKNSTIPEYQPGDIVEIEEDRTLYAVWETDGTIAFEDVTIGAYYYDAVDWAVEKGITAGTDSTHFSPKKACTRGEAVTFLWRAEGSPEPAGDMAFTDVQNGAYYEKAVRWAVEKGVTSGTGSGKFSPNMTCDRSQIVTFLYRAENQPAITGGNSFTDVKAGQYYENAVKWAVENGITSGTGNGKFSPGMKCDRSQIITFLYRYSK